MQGVNAVFRPAHGAPIRNGLPLERVYRMLFNADLFLLAYGIGPRPGTRRAKVKKPGAPSPRNAPLLPTACSDSTIRCLARRTTATQG
jgi:hypothetical protein